MSKFSQTGGSCQKWMLLITQQNLPFVNLILPSDDKESDENNI